MGVCVSTGKPVNMASLMQSRKWEKEVERKGMCKWEEGCRRRAEGTPTPHDDRYHD